jgi:predicted Zn-ribbon and HTH transcriptional regulator
MTLFDRYKALVEQREAARKAAQELQNARHIVVTAHLKEILVIVKSETGIELDVTTESCDFCGFRAFKCSFAVNNTDVNFLWLHFDRMSTTFSTQTQSALPAMVDELVAKTKIACPSTTAK